MNDIYPCFHCESTLIDLTGDFKKFSLICRQCGNEGKSSESIHEAQILWNKYQLPPDQLTVNTGNYIH
jgi:hypothetical protein